MKGRASTLALYLLPVTAVVAITLAATVVGAPQPYVGARIYGGPTEASERLSFRVEVVERYEEYEHVYAGQPLQVQAVLADGRRLSFEGVVDDRGTAFVSWPLGGKRTLGSVALSATTPGRSRELARGNVTLTQREWRAGARERGGWVQGHTEGKLEIRIAPMRGVLAVPFEDSVLIEVRENGQPRSGVELELSLEGLQRLGKQALSSDARGRCRLRVRPLEHVTLLVVTARDPGGGSSKWSGSLPVLPGAMFAEADSGKLVIRSPIQRELAYYALLNQHERLFAGSVALKPDGRGGALGHVPLPNSSGDLWAVVSSEPDLGSPSSVGWPLKVGDEPELTFGVPDRLWLEGLSAGFAREAARRSRARWLAAAIAGVSLSLVLLLLWLRVRGAQAELSRHLVEAGEAEEERTRIAPPSNVWKLVVAFLCIALGFAVIALAATARLS